MNNKFTLRVSTFKVFFAANKIIYYQTKTSGNNLVKFNRKHKKKSKLTLQISNMHLQYKTLTLIISDHFKSKIMQSNTANGNTSFWLEQILG